MLNEEGGVDRDESYFEVLVDRVNTTASVWLGSTIGCAQCHNHKYDPFTQKQYYQLMAFFNNSAKKVIPNGAGFEDLHSSARAGTARMGERSFVSCRRLVDRRRRQARSHRRSEDRAVQRRHHPRQR
jgi:hypothetical protein